MYEIKTTLTVCGAHELRLSYPSPCTKLHGHNWVITVYCRSMALDGNGMLIDFSEIKRRVNEAFDHKKIDIGINPTAENIAKYICDLIGRPCYRVRVEETAGNIATFTLDDGYGIQAQ